MKTWSLLRRLNYSFLWYTLFKAQLTQFLEKRKNKESISSILETYYFLGNEEKTGKVAISISFFVIKYKQFSFLFNTKKSSATPSSSSSSWFPCLHHYYTVCQSLISTITCHNAEFDEKSPYIYFLFWYHQIINNKKIFLWFVFIFNHYNFPASFVFFL